MRLRIKLDVRKPIKRKKKIIKKDGTEFTVNCKYERLGEFCFSCGMVSHTDKFCRNYDAAGSDEGVKEWGSWLRAPPRRVAGQSQSKWLLDENDDTWEDRIGKETNNLDNLGGNNLKKRKEIRKESNNRDLIVTETRAGIGKTNSLVHAKIQGYTIASNMLYRLNEDDNVGLQLEERKRRRSEVEEVGRMEIDMGQQTNGSNTKQVTSETVISGEDLTTSIKKCSG